MKIFGTIRAWLLGLICVMPAAADEVPVYGTAFDGPEAVRSWRPVSGGWHVADGRYVCPNNDGGAQTVSPFPIGDGAIRARAAATQRNKHKERGFGLMKYADADNHIIVRYGSYGNVTVVVQEHGKRRVIQTGYKFNPASDQTYGLEVVIKGDRLMILLDERPVAVVEDLPVFAAPSYVGFYGISACWFDDLRVTADPRGLQGR
ncbi:MAG: hypothetical protein JXR37_05795 [Kiritimatiellae bacterium]|nr:hypothetical protein [Kiritimatiellia bacterium]